MFNYRITFAVLLLLLALFACEKSEDTDIKKVYYATQPGYGGGGNPNPNGLPGSGTTGTTTTNTVTCTRSMVVNGTAGTNVSSPTGSTGNYIITVISSQGTVTMTFPTSAAPAAGGYAVVASAPAGLQCTIDYSGSFATSGVVNVTTGTFNKASCSGIVCGTNTISATACY